MKKLSLAALLAFLCLPASLYADPTPSIQSLSIEAHESGTASTYDYYWQTDWGSYDRDNHQAKKLFVAVHDMSRRVPKVDVEIFFIGMQQETHRFLIYKRADEAVEMAGRIEVIGYVQSPTIKSNEVNYAALGERHVTGVKMEGWIVRGKMDGKTFQVRASNQTLLEIAEGSPRQPLNLETLIEEYAKKNVARGARR